METSIKKEIYEELAPVWSGRAVQEAAEECVVPDRMPDVAAVLGAEGTVTLRSKEAEDGSVLLSASVSAWILYAAEEDGSLQSLELSLPVEVRLDAPGADSDSRPVARLRLRSLEARVVNSRKLALRAEVETDVVCYKRSSQSVPAGLEGDTAGIHLLTKAAGTMPVTDVREKTFVVTDEFSLPAGWNTADRILSRRTEMVLDDVKYVSGKAVFRGRALSQLLLAGEEGQLYAGRYETEFSQIMEIGDGGEEARTEIVLALTGVYYDLPEYGRETGRIGAEIHAAAQCVCRDGREIQYIGDLYSSRAVLRPVWETLTLPGAVRPVSLRQTVAGRVEPDPPTGEILETWASVGGVGIEGSTVKTSVHVRLLLREEEGRYASARCRLSAEFTVPEMAEGAALQDAAVTIIDVHCGAGAGGIDVRAVLQMDALSVSSCRIDCVGGIEAEEDQERPRTPSMTLVRVPAGADLWTLAKRYSSTMEAIQQVNDGRTEGLLLIPKGR